MADAVERSEHKMREHGMSDTAIAQFEHLYEVWSNEESTSWIREEEVEPITDIPSFHDVYETINHEKAVDAFAKTAFLKLNGGLGTSMGLDYAKSLLTVRRHKAKPMRFLDIILGQVVTARKRLGVALPLTLMDSFRTSRDTMAAVAKDRHFEQKDVPVEIIQHVEPKIDVATGEPVTMRFLDIILGQVVTARKRLGVALPLTLMDSFRTSRDTMAAVAKDRHFEQKDVPVEIIQHVEPKIDVATGEPVTWETNPDLEWCPPGHGDLYSTLWESGLLDILLDILEEQGYRYLFISNSDNLGARPSRTLAQHFENTGAPFMIEVARRTQADRKGGHIVRDVVTGRLMLREMTQVADEDRADAMDIHKHPFFNTNNKADRKGGHIVRDVVTGRLMLREMTQVADEDRADAMDIHKHPFFNTNNIWVRIDVLRKKLAECNGVLPLPVIRNYKTVDPTDPTSTKVVQLETAMGAAVNLFHGSICVEVDRMRFLPVKTTDDLFIMRSDRFHLTDSYEMEDGDYHFPNVTLDKRFYKNIRDFEERFPYGVPSIAAAAVLQEHPRF